jgi:hypothetical protein
VTLPVEPLSAAEAADLASAETVIRAGLDTFVDVGNALLSIRDGRLYRATHGTFEDYCRQRWELSSSRARRLIDAADTVRTLEDQSVPVGTVRSPLPTSERHVRPLTQLRDDPVAVRETWQRAVDTAPRDAAGTPRITAAHVEQAVRDELASRGDPAGFALAVNIARRHLTKGQQAMVAAKATSLFETKRSKIAKAVGISTARLDYARAVLNHAPDLADAVVAGSLPLDRAYATARERKRAAESTEAQMAHLRADAADLADLVVEERAGNDSDPTGSVNARRATGDNHDESGAPHLKGST